MLATYRCSIAAGAEAGQFIALSGLKAEHASLKVKAFFLCQTLFYGSNHPLSLSIMAWKLP
jgi:hypothetical protein